MVSMVFALLSYVERCQNLQSVLMILQSPEEDRNETTGDKLSNLTSGSATASLNDHHSKLKMKGKLRIPLMWTNLWGKVRNHSFTAFIFSVENNNKAF